MSKKALFYKTIFQKVFPIVLVLIIGGVGSILWFFYSKKFAGLVPDWTPWFVLGVGVSLTITVATILFLYIKENENKVFGFVNSKYLKRVSEKINLSFVKNTFKNMSGKISGVNPIKKINREQCARSEIILLVDDEPEVKELVNTYLGSLGYHTICAGNAHEAMYVADKFTGKIDVLLTDLVMPKINGMELGNAISLKRKDLKIIYMSGVVQFEQFRLNIHNSSAEFLQKPFTVNELAGAIRIALDKSLIKAA